METNSLILDACAPLIAHFTVAISVSPERYNLLICSSTIIFHRSVSAGDQM
jgi:hypothetical protein